MVSILTQLTLWAFLVNLQHLFLKLPQPISQHFNFLFLLTVSILSHVQLLMQLTVSLLQLFILSPEIQNHRIRLAFVPLRLPPLCNSCSELIVHPGQCLYLRALSHKLLLQSLIPLDLLLQLPFGQACPESTWIHSWSCLSSVLNFKLERVVAIGEEFVVNAQLVDLLGHESGDLLMVGLR